MNLTKVTVPQDIDPVLTRIVLGGREESVGDIIRRMEMVVKARKWPICQPEASNSNLNKVVLLAHSMGNDIWLYRKKVLGSEAELQKEVRLDKVAHKHDQLSTMQISIMCYRLLLCKWCHIAAQSIQVHFTRRLVVWHDTALIHMFNSTRWPA